MKTIYDLPIRAFPVKIRDQRTGEESYDRVVLDKARLQAAQTVGQSSRELIERLYEKQGYKVMEIGKPDKLTIEIFMDRAYEELLTRDQREAVALGDQ